MTDFRDAIAGRLCALLKPRHVLLAGGRDAGLAATLAQAAAGNGAILHVARPAAPDWVRALRTAHGDACVLHEAAPADAIGVLPVPELCWVDADPNWFTVTGILNALAAQAARLGRPFPVTLVEGAGWPFGRRDSYDDPGAIPVAARRPHERSGVRPGQAALAGSAGLHADRYNASAENEPGNGILTAVEDFCLERTADVRVLILPGFGGLAAICPRTGAGAGAFAADGLATDLAAVAASLETLRLDQALRLREQEIALQQAVSLRETLRTLRPGTQAPAPTQTVAPRVARVRRRARRAVFMARLAARGRLGAWRAAERARHAEAENAARLRASPAFDAVWYLAHYPDVAAAGDDAALHYLRCGAAESRDPGPFFSTSYYVMNYPDVATAGHNPLLHYLASGAAEGRNPGPHFASRQYLQENPDVAAAGHNPLEHYLACGRAEGRGVHPV